MLRYLFPRLTPAPAAELYDAVVAEARKPHWYLEGGIADTIDGRFAMLATLLALVLVRLEREDRGASELSVVLTERFIDSMESEHRELGLSDQKLGRTVRKLVGSLSRRVDLWRLAVAGEQSWQDSTRASLYKSEPASDALSRTCDGLRLFWSGLEKLDGAKIAEGSLE